MNTLSDQNRTLMQPIKIADVLFKPLHPDFPKVELFSQFIKLTISLAILIPFIYLVVGSPFQSWAYSSLVLIFCIVLSLSYQRAKTCRYALQESAILYDRGLFVYKTTAISFKRIQHIDLTHGPLQRKYKIASLKFFTAGGSSADLQIPGLPQEDAIKIRQVILADQDPESQNSSPETDSSDPQK